MRFLKWHFWLFITWEPRLLDTLLISDLCSSGIMRPFTGCLLSTVWRTLGDHIFKRVTCPVLYWTSDPWRYDHVQRRISDPSRCGHYRVSKRWTVTQLTYGFDHRGNRIQYSSVSGICLSLVHTGCRTQPPYHSVDIGISSLWANWARGD